jgi:hypothetical protein
MTILPDLFKRAQQLLCVVVLLVLSACGPGTGGTGTGPNTSVMSYNGMVSTSFGAGLSAGVPCSDDCPVVNLLLESAKVELIAPCHRFVHEGAWAADATGLAVLEGQLETTAIANGQTSTAKVPAVMRLQFSDAQVDSRQVMLTVRDASGRNLLSPLTLQRGEGRQAASACAPAKQ